MENAPQPQKKNEVEQVGGIFGIILVVAILAAGGICFLLMQRHKIEQNQQELQAPANS